MPKSAIQKQQQRRLLRDRNAAWLIRFGGWTVLAALLVLLWHLISVVLPIFKEPEIRFEDTWQLPSQGQLVHFSRIHDSTFVVTRVEDCRLAIHQGSTHAQPLNTQQWQLLKRVSIPCQDKVTISEYAGVLYLAQLSENRILRVSELIIGEDEVEQQQVYSTRLSDLPFSSVKHWELTLGENKWALTFKLGNGWQLYWLEPEDPLQVTPHWYANAAQVLPLPEMMTTLVNMKSSVQYRSFKDELLWEQYSNIPILHLTPFPSNKSFMMLDNEGVLTKWALTYPGEADSTDLLSFTPLYRLPVQGQFADLLFHPRNMLGVLAGSEKLTLFNSSTGEVLSETSIPTVLQHKAKTFVPEGSWLNRKLAFRLDKRVLVASIENANSILTFQSLFLPTQYEGYDQAEYVWQSSSGADHHEPKYSVIPLIIGSVKAALIALLVALPLGLGAAVYTAYFAPSESRQWLKPAIEMLEAVPSVVIGFIAAVWLLPLPEEHLAGLLSFMLLLPLFAFVLAWLNKWIQHFRGFSLPMNLFACFGYLLVFAYLVSELVPPIMQFMTWLQLPSLFFLEELDTHSKNTIVVAIALGIAIAPSIYSLAEDAIFEVPSSLRRASYALGATRLQTLLNVVLKVAYPGILSALMLGFSRALGETMILLMVTGNTPIAEWDLMAGMRTMTANLAIELPESEVGGIHYQVLFLTALLLLVFTMSINTVAELLRLRLRRKYRHE